MTPIPNEDRVRKAASYLDAALNKLEVAAYCQTQLAATLLSERADRVKIQTYFEGTLHAGVAATDQVAEAANLGFALALDKPNLRAALNAMDGARSEADFGELVADLGRWRENDMVVEAAALRRRATHHYYPKGERQGEWIYEASDGVDIEQGGSVGALAQAFISELERFRDLIWRLATAMGAMEALAQLRDSH